MKYKLIKTYPGFEELNQITWFGPNNMLNPEKYPEFWEKVVEKDYEILSFKSLEKFKHGHLVHMNQNNFKPEKYLSSPNYWEIHSVKRLSDGEIFIIGDNIEFNIHSYKKAIATITSFKLYGDNLCFLNDDLMYNASLDIIGNKIKQPLFTTEQRSEIEEIIKNKLKL